MDNPGIPSSFARLTYGNRIAKYLRLAPSPDLVYAQDGTYVEVPLGSIGATVDIVDEVAGSKVPASSRSRRVELVAKCEIEPQRGNGYKYLIEPNPELWKLGIVQAPYYLHGGEGKLAPTIQLYITGQVDKKKLSSMYLVRIYMRQ